MAHRAHRKHRWSLSAHLTWVVLLALVPALLIQYASNLEVRREARTRAQEQALQLVGDLADQQEQITTSARQMLTTLSFLPEVQRKEGSSLSRILKALQQEDPRFSDIFALDPQGRAFASATTVLLNTTALDRKYFWEALESRRFSVGEYSIGRSTGTRTLHFSQPVLNPHGGLAAVLVAAYDLERYSEVFDRTSLPPGTSLAVLDHRGTVLYGISAQGDPKGSLVGRTLPTDEMAAMAGGNQGTYWAGQGGGDTMLFAYHQVRAPGQTKPYLFIRLGRPEIQVLAASETAFRRNSALMVIVGILALAAAWIMGDRMIASPIRRLVKASRRIASGNLGLRPKVGTGSREVAELAEELGEMNSALAQREEEQSRIQDALGHAQKMESLGVLAGGIAHDFNNLLAVVMGNLNLAQMHLGPGTPVQRPLDQAERAVIKASGLARQLLAYSGHGHFVVRVHDLNRMLEEMANLLQTPLSRKVRLSLHLGRELPSINADVAQIQQMVLNLVTNAAEAIGCGEGTVTLRTAAQSLSAADLLAKCPAQDLAPGSYVVLEVSDTGCGMCPDLIQRIFDPFFTTKTAGRGLGLSAIHGILKGHGAGLCIESEPGRGSTFRILFPANPQRVQPPAEMDPDQVTRFSGTALVADDEPMIREFAAAALAIMGFSVVEARDGVEALARFKEAPDLVRIVLLDITMPRMDGLETFAALRQIRPELPIILNSGYDQDAAARQLVGKGPSRFLAKPYQMRDLRRVVAEALDESPAEVKSLEPSILGA